MSRRIARTMLPLIAVLLTVGTSLPAAGQIDVPLTIRNDLPVVREALPMSVGVPFPQGVLSSTDQLSVDGPTGPVAQWQATPLARWWDGSVRWALVDFPADVGALGSTVYTVRDGGASNASGLQVSQAGDIVTVSTGAIEFTVNTTSFRGLETLQLDSDGDGSYDRTVIEAGASPGLVVVQRGGAEYTAANAAPTTFAIEEEGAQRVTLLFKGELTRPDAGLPLLKYVLRLSAFAGRGDVKMQVTLHNPNKGSLDFNSTGAVFFEDARIELATNLQSASLRAGQDEGSAALDWNLGSGNFYIHQDSSGDLNNWNLHTAQYGQSYRGWRAFAGATGNEQQLAAGDRAAGWVEITDNSVIAVAGISEFWQNFPNALSANGSGRLAAHFFSPWQSRDFEMRGGEQKTHVVWFRFAPAAARDSAIAMPGLMDRIIGLASPDYYAGTGCFRRFLPKSKSDQLPEMRNWTEMQLATLEGGRGWRGAYDAFRNRRDDDVFGWRDWGDFFAEYENQGDRANGENDFAFGAILNMVRTGDSRWWRLFDPLARHLADIDVYHAEFEDQYYEFRLGGFFTHDRGGTNTHRGIAFPETNHYNAQGMFYYHYLTGDRVVIDSAMEVANNSKWRTDAGADGGYDYGFSFIDSDTEMRSSAWLLNIINEGWKYTRDNSWRDSALNIVERTQPETRCWYDTIPCEYPYNNKTFVDTWQMAKLMDAVGEFQDERVRQSGTRDARATRLLDLWGKWLQEKAWLPDAQNFGNQYDASTGVVSTDWAAGNMLRVIDALVQAYHATGDASHLRNLDLAWQTATANPWYDGSGVTYADIKMAATMARNGHDYMDLIGSGVIPGTGNCLPAPSTSPGDGTEWLTGSPILLLFGMNVDLASVEAALSVSGSQSGAFNVSVSTQDQRTLVLTLSPTPATGETVQISLAASAQSFDGKALDGNRDGQCGDSFAISFSVGSNNGGPDLVPPVVTSAYSLVFGAGGNTSVSMVVPDDDGPTGSPSSVEVRYQALGDGGVFDWDSAATTGSRGISAVAGQVETIALPTVDAQIGSLWAAVQTKDAAGNLSPVSTPVTDASPPAVSFANSPIQVKAGGSKVLVVPATDINHGNGRLDALRYWFDTTDPVGAIEVPVVHDPATMSEGSAQVVVDASGWFAGEDHSLRVEARDAAGNWTQPSGVFQITAVDGVPVEACAQISRVTPVSGSAVTRLAAIQIGFSEEMQQDTIDMGGLEVLVNDFRVDPAGLDWTVPGRVLELFFKPPLVTRSDVSIRFLAGAVAADGGQLGEAGCEPAPTITYSVRPEAAPNANPGSDLASVDDHGRLAVDGFEVLLSNVTPGGVLRFYDEAGRLLHSQDVDLALTQVDTSQFGNFPSKLLIVEYRGFKQKVIVGRGQAHQVPLQ